MKHYSSILLLLSVASIPFDAIVNFGFVRISSTEVLFSVAFFASSVDMFRARKQILTFPVFLPMVLFTFACFLSLVNASSVVATVRESIQFGWLFAIFYFVMIKSENNALYSPTIAIIVVLTGAVSIVGIYQYFFVNEPIHFQVAGFRLRAHGFYDQPNAFGGFLIGVLPLLLVTHLLPATISDTVNGTLRRVYTFLRNKSASLMLSGIVSTGLIMSFSRGSWVGCMIGVLVITFFVRKMNLLSGLVLPIVIVVMIAAIVLFDISGQPKKVDREFSNNQRTLLLEASLSMFMDYPILGVGLGNFPIRLPEYASDELKKSILWDYDPLTKQWFVNPHKESKIELVHNMFLQVATETGIIGFAAFLFMVVQFFRTALTRIHNAVLPVEKMRYVASLAGASAILCGGIFGWPFSHGVQELLVVLMALAVA